MPGAPDGRFLTYTPLNFFLFHFFYSRLIINSINYLLFIHVSTKRTVAQIIITDISIVEAKKKNVKLLFEEKRRRTKDESTAR